MSRFGRESSFMTIMNRKLERRRERSKMSKKERKREKQLYKATKDGKITKKEAKRLQKKGISERDVQRYDAKAFRKEQKSFDKRSNRYRDMRPAERGPSYSPLLISKGAGRTFGDPRPPRQSRDNQSQNNQMQEVPDPGFTPTYLPTDYDDQTGTGGEGAGSGTGGPTEPQGPSAEQVLADQIAALQASFLENMQTQQGMFSEMQTAQDTRMQELNAQMQQAMLANQQAALYNREQPQVAGVQSAASSAGSPMQIARRGVTGAFGRRGMRISSLNI